MGCCTVKNYLDSGTELLYDEELSGLWEWVAVRLRTIWTLGMTGCTVKNCLGIEDDWLYCEDYYKNYLECLRATHFGHNYC